MEQLFNDYGVIGIVAGIFLTAIIYQDKRHIYLIKKIEKIKDEQIDELKKEIERLQDREVQKTIDTHELMDDIKEAVKGLTNIAVGFREMVNIISEQLKRNK